MTEAGQILSEARSILLVDWPSTDVPETLARAGYTVLVQGGPQPDNYSVYEVRDGEVVSRRTGRAPAAVDLVYSYRPIEELAGIAAMAQRLGADAVWLQSGVASDGRRPRMAAGWIRRRRRRRARSSSRPAWRMSRPPTSPMKRAAAEAASSPPREARWPHRTPRSSWAGRTGQGFSQAPGDLAPVGQVFFVFTFSDERSPAGVTSALAPPLWRRPTPAPAPRTGGGAAPPRRAWPPHHGVRGRPTTAASPRYGAPPPMAGNRNEIIGPERRRAT